MTGWVGWAVALAGAGIAAVLLAGSVMIARDEWRLRRTRPKPEEVRAYADRLEASFGPMAFAINSRAMGEARRADDFARYRFLKEVSGELARRLVVPAAADAHPPCRRTPTRNDGGRCRD